ncbi:MAG: hypothetical protein U9O59_01820, partial [Actinomycetota bacterium]|nr:hypothetical protein [Actinomycetota bacterium]
RKKLPVYNCINHSTIMFRNTGDAGYRKKFKYSQDYDFYLNLLSKNLMPVNMKDVLIRERIIQQSITYLRRGEQEFFKKLAQDFYYERIKSGKDSYPLFDEEKVTEIEDRAVKKESAAGKKYFYGMQKIYYLLFSGRTRKARKEIRVLLKEKFNIKLFLYLITSFFPFAVKIRNKIKGLEFS